MRPLTICEDAGTIARHEKAGTVIKILGCYMGGFSVKVLEGQSAGKVMMMPFEGVDQWVVDDD